MEAMEEIKFVLNELNQPPFSKNLNLIGYDNLRGEQRLDLLIEALNVIDPKMGLPSVRMGNIDEIITTILDTLRIFKYTPPPEQFNPIEFRKSLILADKDLITSLLAWLLSRLPALKKRAYLARFLVRIELSAEVEGDHDVLLVYKQYLKLIVEFKRVHVNYEAQRRSIDSVVELQRDIKSMEIEREQIKNKLEVLQRRADFRSTQDEGNKLLFENVQQFVHARLEGDKLEKQLMEQGEKIDKIQRKLEEQQIALSETKAISSQLGSVNMEPEEILIQMEDEVAIRQRLAKVVLPAELEETRSLVKELEEIELDNDMTIKEKLSKAENGIHMLDSDIKHLLDGKLKAKSRQQEEEENDHLGHYRANAQLVANKKEEVQKQFRELEKELNQQHGELDRMRAKFNDGDLPLRGDALKGYIEAIAHQDVEVAEKNAELESFRIELQSLEAKVRTLKKEEVKTLAELDELEEAEGIEGYYRMQEMNLNAVADDNDDGLEDGRTDLETIDVRELRRAIDRLETECDAIKTTLGPTHREVGLLKEAEIEMENEFEMKRRLYDAAAAGLETELGRSKGDLRKQKAELARLRLERHRHETELIVQRAEKEFRLERDDDNQSPVVKALKAEIEREETEADMLKQRAHDLKTNEQYYKRQIDMWRDLKTIFEVKANVAARRQEDKVRKEAAASANFGAGNVNRLVIE